VSFVNVVINWFHINYGVSIHPDDTLPEDDSLPGEIGLEGDSYNISDGDVNSEIAFDEPSVEIGKRLILFFLHY
jgi:hypothetical protein